MDRKTLAAVALCVLFLVFYRPMLRLAGLEKYLPQAQPVATASRDSSSATMPAPGTSTAVTPPPGAAPSIAAGSAPGLVAAQTDESAASGALFAMPVHSLAADSGQTYALETPSYRATFTGRGARLLGVELKQFASANGPGSRNGRAVRPRSGQQVPPGDRVVLNGAPLFGLDLGSGAARLTMAGAHYAVRESLDASGQRVALMFVATDSSGATVRQTYRVRSDPYTLGLDVELRGVPVSWRLADYSLTVRSWPLLTEADEVADARSLRATSLVGTSLHREQAARIVDKPRTFEGSAAWAAVQSRYFVAAVAPVKGGGRAIISSAVRRPMLPAEKAAFPPGAHAEIDVADNSLAVGLPSELEPTRSFVLYVGPCEYFQLASLKLQLERLVDLGWSWIHPFSRALLWLMRWLYGVVHNYGVAIILLATLVRLLLHPLNVAGLKSMRAMQRIQPELERIRAKHKDDPTTLNTRMMALYKEHKVNPAGGCLPTLVQVPVFFALYSVLFNAIELRQAPFVGWIHDLSAPDLLFTVASFPIRLLPVLMLGSGLLSQRLTPSDPRQMPTMYLMNAFMTVFFYNLPSGLVLYWTLMNVLTAVQQWLVLRQDGGPAVVVLETVPANGKSRKR